MNQGNALSQLLFDSALSYAITKVQEKYNGLNLSGTFWSRLNSIYWEGTNKYKTTTTTTTTATTTTTTTTIIIIIITMIVIIIIIIIII